MIINRNKMNAFEFISTYGLQYSMYYVESELLSLPSYFMMPIIFVNKINDMINAFGGPIILEVKYLNDKFKDSDTIRLTNDIQYKEITILDLKKSIELLKKCGLYNYQDDRVCIDNIVQEFYKDNDSIEVIDMHDEYIILKYKNNTFDFYYGYDTDIDVVTFINHINDSIKNS